MNKKAIILISAFLIIQENSLSEKKEELLKFLTDGMKAYFVIRDKKLNWYEAYEFCRSKGLQLASPNTALVNTGLKAVLSRDKLLNDEGIGYWISLTDLGQTKTYKWLSTGEPAIYSDFLPGEPTHDKGPCGLEHCVQLGMKNGKTGWNDRLCTYKSHFICEK